MSETDAAIVRHPDALYTAPQATIETFDPARYVGMREVALGLSRSGLIPEAYRGKPEDIMLAMEVLRTVGLNPVASLSDTYVINARVKIYGEAWLGIIQATPGYGGMAETWDAQKDGGTATCTFRRFIGGTWQSLTKDFSMARAKSAKLVGKGTYETYPQELITWRARTRAGALFSDRLHGLKPAEAGADETELTYDAPPPPPAVPIDTQEQAKLAEAPNRSSHVIAEVVLERESKPDAKSPWKLWAIKTVDGETYYSKEADIADFATSLKGKAAVISFAPAAQNMRVVTRIEPVEP